MSSAFQKTWHQEGIKYKKFENSHLKEKTPKRERKASKEAQERRSEKSK